MGEKYLISFSLQESCTLSSFPAGGPRQWLSAFGVWRFLPDKVLIRANGQDRAGIGANDVPDASGADPALAAHYGASLLALQTAICYCEIGLTGQAVELYEEHMTVEGFSRRDYDYFRALSGLALASDGRPDEAAAADREALNLAIATSSARTMKKLTRLLTQLHPWPDRPAVQSLQRELTSSVSPAV